MQCKDEFDLEDFVDWVDECRHDAMLRERKLAGFGYWKVECFREASGHPGRFTASSAFYFMSKVALYGLL